MHAKATRLEHAVLALALLALSGAPTSLYTKGFGYAPPTPDIVVVAPILALMIANAVVRLRETVLGGVAAWPWTCLAGLALASTTWSIAPGETLREAAVMVVAVPYLAMAAGLFSWRDIIGHAWGVGVALVGLSLAMYVALPEFARMQDVYAGALSGVWFEKNASGQFAMVVALLTLARGALRPASAPLMVGVWALLVGFLVLTQSATALIVAVACAGAALWVALMRRQRVVALPLLWVSLAVVAPALMALAARPELVVELAGRTDTLSGRIPIWDAVRTFALPERPDRGFGYTAYWSEDFAYGNRAYVYDALEFEARHAHNAWLEIRLGLGRWGGWLWLAALCQLAVMAVVRLRGSAGSYFVVPMVCAVGLVGLVETSPTLPGNWVGAMFILCLAKSTLVPRPQDRVSGWREWLHGVQTPLPTGSGPHGSGPLGSVPGFAKQATSARKAA